MQEVWEIMSRLFASLFICEAFCKNKKPIFNLKWSFNPLNIQTADATRHIAFVGDTAFKWEDLAWTHPVKTAQVFDEVFIRGRVIVDHSMLFVHTTRLGKAHTAQRC